jgi:hypothetical protein
MIAFVDNREIEVLKYINKSEAWEMSLDYATFIKKNCEKQNINDIILITYSKYLNGLKSSNIGITNNFKYIRVWDTLINTLKNKKNSRKKIICAINQLHYTNVINN